MAVNTFPSTIITFTILLLAAGMAFGLVVSGTAAPLDLAPDVVHAAQEQDGAPYAKLERQIELTYAKRMREAELAARQAENEQQLALARERHAQELAQLAQRAQLVDSLLPVLAAGLLLALLVASGGLAYYLACVGRSQLVAAQASSRAEAVRLARQAERDWRAAHQPAANGNGHRRERVGV